MQPGSPARPDLSHIRHIVPVASGKGGVGKSTVAANLALALLQLGQRVGLLDSDIYGPSVPMMFGLNQAELQPSPAPFERFGLKLASMGFFPEFQHGALLRGPMVAKYQTLLLTQIQWGPLDFLVIDMPPGTGDAQLTLCQLTEPVGAVIVTTPQDVSLIDAGKAMNMFAQLRVPILGVIENMSYFVGDDGKRYEIFRHGGGKELAERAKVPFLAEIPIDPRMAVCGDAGVPFVQQFPDAPVSQVYQALAAAVLAEAAKAAAARLPEAEL